DALETAHPDTIVGEQLLIFVHLGEEHVAERAALLFKTVVELVDQAADAERVGGQPRATIVLEDFEDLFALAETVEYRRDGADIERVRSQPQQVARNPVQLGEN